MTNLTLRLPDDLHTELVTMARRNRRSLNSEIVFHLGQLEPEPESGPLNENDVPDLLEREEERLRRIAERIEKIRERLAACLTTARGGAGE